MANQEQLEILRQGTKVWNKWRRSEFRGRIDLENANIRITTLSEADLSRANLKNAKLGGSNLGRVDFTDANLSQSDLTDAQLEKAIFTRTNLFGANLSGVRLWETVFNGADLNKAYLGAASLDHTMFVGIDLGQTYGLEDVVHRASSVLNSETIRLSKGKIPLVFLRGCGFGDIDIEFTKLAIPGLDPEQVTDITYKIHQLYLGGGVQYYSCFISYNSKDEEFAEFLHDDLQNNGVRCWFAPEDMKIGDQIRPRIDQEIRLRDKLLVILSENSVRSEWVGDEVEAALEEESKSNRLVLFPIRLDDTVMSTRDDWAAKIKRRRHIGDFSNWKDKASYQKAFERLLRDLKATGG